ncbi:hypothetical protein SSABA_v1c01400 [Spiroplasma sabaudiense Ar-1343]|uniref:Transmembrane protein n=1 Tax=Spiroplasma sabaudiense Ar-1343 TaxID=1276257 RepID=W6A960_9MOLU|nr:hypothetical protein [Spiroplasma sabaudiense]AHI53552.1 hypothetical protein SSABA_v1c01400 [Spiroplasma sabaudiense Ar-1343]
MSKKIKVLNNEFSKETNPLHPGAVSFSFFLRITAFFICMTYFVVLLIVLISDVLTKDIIIFLYYYFLELIGLATDNISYNVYLICWQVIFPILFALSLGLLYLLPIIISKSRGFRIFIGISSMILAISLLTITILFVEFKDLWNDIEFENSSTAILRDSIVGNLKYNSFLIIFLLAANSSIIAISIFLFIEASLAKKGLVDLKVLTFNKFKNRHLIIKFLEGDETFVENKNPKKTKPRSEDSENDLN